MHFLMQYVMQSRAISLQRAVGSWPTFEGAYREKGQANCPLAHKHINEFYFSGMFL